MNTPTEKLLPLPRFLLKRGQVVDRWTGKAYDGRPAVLVGVLNRLVAQMAIDADVELVKRAEFADQRAAAKARLAQDWQAQIETLLKPLTDRAKAAESTTAELAGELNQLRMLAAAGKWAEVSARLQARPAAPAANPFAKGGAA
ncbi:MAG: hypothetical protein KIT75_03430 [Planctomycetota bacterium]|nr:hypothetical protein [Planctomycetota bacterium]